MAINSELNADRLADVIYAIANNTDSIEIRQGHIDTLLSLFGEATSVDIEVVDFDPALVFDMDRIYNPHTQVGAITFTFSESTEGVTTKARIVSNGAAITFPIGAKIYQEPSTLTFTSGTTYDFYFIYDHGGVTINIVEVFETV